MDKHKDQQLELAIFETMTVVIETANIQKQIFCMMIYMAFNTFQYDYVVEIWLFVLFSISLLLLILFAWLIFIVIIAHREFKMIDKNSEKVDIDILFVFTISIHFLTGKNKMHIRVHTSNMWVVLTENVRREIETETISG